MQRWTCTFGLVMWGCLSNSNGASNGTPAPAECINAGSCGAGEYCTTTGMGSLTGHCAACGKVNANQTQLVTQSCDDDTDCSAGLTCDHCVCVRPATCDALDVAGTWTQSYACYSSAGDCCERDDNDTFTIAQNCQSLTVTGNLDLFTPTLAGNVVTWSGADEAGTPNVDDDYTESGTWTFTDTDNFTSSSTFTFKNHAGGGPCVANGRKGGTPTPVTPPSECAGKPTCGS